MTIPSWDLTNEDVHFLMQPSKQHLSFPGQSQSELHSASRRIAGQGLGSALGHCPNLAGEMHLLVQPSRKQHFSPSAHSESSEQPVIVWQVGVGFKTGQLSSRVAGEKQVKLVRL